MSNAKTVTAGKGYYVVPLGEVEKDWKKVALTNRLLRLGWDIYRNTSSFNHYPAGSFYIPLGGLPISQARASAYLKKRAQELGISPISHKEELPANGLVKLVRPRMAVLFATGEKWALMTLNVLEVMGFDVDALGAEDIRQGALDHANVLFIPGGSHTDKATDVGPEGEAKVKEFVRRGGGVLGFCGGAALSAQVKEGWGLLAVERESGKVPKTMHGPIWIKPEVSDHPLWYGYPSQGFPLAPWYGRALHPLNEQIRVLGRYDRPTDDFYIDHELTGSFFSKYLPEEMGTLDKVYNGLANPTILQGLAAIIEGEYGAGRIIVGYPHPETPGLEGGFLLLANAVYHVTQNPPLDDRPWLPSPGKASSYNEKEVLALLEEVKEAHVSLVIPIARDLVRFGTNNLYWTPRQHIPWCYIGAGKYPFYVCERLEAYGDEILRQLRDLPRLINEIDAKRKRLAPGGTPNIKEGLTQLTARLEDVYRLSGQALSDTLEIYRSRMKADLTDWGTHFKKILLYHQLLAIMKAKDTEANLVEDVTGKNRKLTDEYLGGWRWAQTSKKYRAIFTTLDATSYYLSNLKFELLDVSLQLDYLI